MTKKNKNLYSNDKQVKKCKADLKKLERKKEEIKNKIDSLMADQEKKCKIPPGQMHWMERLPIESLTDLYKFDKGLADNFGIQSIKIIAKLRKEKEQHESKLEALSKEIVNKKIDLLQAKIDCLNKKITPGQEIVNEQSMQVD